MANTLVGKKEYWILLSWLCTAPLWAGGCGAEAEHADSDALGTGVAQQALGVSAYGACSSVTRASGWANAAIPESTSETGSFTVQFRGTPGGQNDAGNPIIDGLIGFSSGPAHAFSDLGPIVRFNENGAIDARNGSGYSGAFPYRTAIGPFEFKLDVNLATHRYTTWVRHLEGADKPWELLGQDLAFRSEQAGMTRINNVAWLVDGGDQEQLQAPCSFSYSTASSCLSSDAGGAWQSRAFAARSAPFRVEFFTTAANGIDAVVGVASGAPASFSALAAIVRFRTDGTFDARNGATYAADATVSYQAGQSFRIGLDIDPTRGTYSAEVFGPYAYDPPTVIAHDYAFRSEQAGVSSLDHVAQFVDGESGILQVCNPTVID